MELKLRPTVIADDKLEDDYQVIWDGIPIGRILKSPGIPNGLPAWSWGVIFPHMPQEPWQRGREGDLEEAKKRFKLAWSGVHAKLTEDDIRKAREQAEDNRKRWRE